jgi:trk system potassium uptake protein TrkA
VKIIIVGCGRVGSQLAELLDATHQITVIDPNPENLRRLPASFRGQVIAGIGFDHNTLIRAGVETADALAAVFSNDPTNLVVARAARDHFKVPVVVARLYDPCNTDLYTPFGIQTVSSTTWGVQRIRQIITCQKLDLVATLGNGQVQVLEVNVPPHLAARPISDLLIDGAVAIVGLTRGGNTVIPSPDTRLEEGDLVCLSVAASAVSQLEARVWSGG